MATNEKGLQANIVKAIRREYVDAWIMKVHGSPYQMTGVPDLLVVVSGRLIGIEVKFPRPGESTEGTLSRVSPGQWAQIKRIRMAGGVAGPALSVDSALSLIELALSAQHRP